MIRERLQLLGLLPLAGPSAIGFMSAVELVACLLPAAVALATGAFVAGLATGASNGTAVAAEIWISATVLALLLVADQSVGGFSGPASELVARRINARVREEVRRLTVMPSGIAHLEDQDFRNDAVLAGEEFSGRRGLNSIGSGVAGQLHLMFRFLGGVTSGLVIARFSVVLAAVVVASNAICRASLRRNWVGLAKLRTEMAPLRREADYWSEVASRPAMAKDLRIFGFGRWAVDRRHRAILDWHEPEWAVVERALFRQWVVVTVGLVSSALSFGVAALAAYRGEVSLAVLTSTLSAVIALYGLGAMGFEAYDIEQAREYTAALSRLRAAMPGIAPASRSTSVSDGPGTIRFEGVTFTYPGMDRPVLNELDLEIEAGRSLAIVGLNGAGKTTLIKLLAGLYTPQSGRVTVDGVGLDDVGAASWRRELAVIFQDFVRYELSAADNVGLGAPLLRRDLDAIAGVADVAQARSLIERLSDGWSTTLSSGYRGGVDLSGGEWQRVAVARALLALRGGSRVLVLDEPTASLDVRVERDLFDRAPRGRGRCDDGVGFTPVLDRAASGPDRGDFRGTGTRARFPRGPRRPRRRVRPDVRAPSVQIPRPEPGLERPRMIRTRLPRLRRVVSTAWRVDRPKTLAILVLIAVEAASSAVVSLGLKWTVDGVASHDAGLTRLGVVAVTGAYVFFLFGGRTRDNFQLLVSQRVATRIDHELLLLVAEAPGLEHLERGDYLDRLKVTVGQGAAVASAAWAVMNTAAVLVRLGLSVLLLVSVSPAFAVLPLFAVPSVLLAPRGQHFQQRARQATAETARTAEHLHRLFLDPATAKELRVFGTDTVLSADADGCHSVVTRTVLKAQLQAGFLQVLGWVIFGGAYLAALAILGNRVTRGDASLGAAILLTQLASQLRGQVAGAVQGVSTFTDGLDTIDRVLWLEAYADASRHVGTVPVAAAIAEGIRLDHVSFNYPGTDALVLDDINLDIAAGTTLAVVGENGVGKTSLVKLLCGFYQPTSGRIMVDGHDLADLDLQSWREHISVCFQDFARLETLARETVGVGWLQHIDDHGVVSTAIDQGDASAVVASLPLGIDTPLGRTYWDGHELSGGQWQRFALARMMMRPQPVLLILDEPTSALDAPAEHALFERYTSASRTASTTTGCITLLISHRFSTVRMADEIVVVDQGRIVERGTHQELVALGGTYAQMYDIQAKAYE